MAGKIFINYRRDDSAPHALSIAQYLERTFGSGNVFIDVDRMRAGQTFPSILEQRLAQSTVMLAVIGPRWIEVADDHGRRRLDDPEDWVRLEIVRALQRGITVIPVLVGGAGLPRRSDLPDDLKPLTERHAAVVTTNGFRHEMAGLASDIRSLDKRPRMRMGIGIAGALIVCAAAGTALWQTSLQRAVPQVAVNQSQTDPAPAAKPPAKTEPARTPKEAPPARAASGDTNPAPAVAVMQKQAAPAAIPAHAWQKAYPEITLAFVAEGTNDAERWRTFADYLARRLAVNVKIEKANDYAGLIEGARSRGFHIGHFGPASLARALISGLSVEPFAVETNDDGTFGYYSVAIVKSDTTYKSLNDLKGRAVCLVDPNSTSGNHVPRLMMSKLGIEPETFFSKVLYAGSHENAVRSLIQGICDVAFNWWNSDNTSNMARMVEKGLLKDSDYRVIVRSDMIPNAPMAYLRDLPYEMKAAIAESFLEADKLDPAAVEKLLGVKSPGFRVITPKSYEPVIELIKFVDDWQSKRKK